MQPINLPANVLLIRVAADQSYGKWNGPCNPQNRDFVYVPIPQVSENIKGMERTYATHLQPALQSFSFRNQVGITLPKHLMNLRMHLDPDFDNLTYGDQPGRVSRIVKLFQQKDWILFYSGLQSVITPRPLIYALIGLFVIDKIRKVVDIPKSEFDKNAHTRIVNRNANEIIINAIPGQSGCFTKYIEIGDYRDRAYRVKQSLLNEWGGISVRNGYLQRSAQPPHLLDPKRFAGWLFEQDTELMAANNILEASPQREDIYRERDLPLTL